MMRILSLLSVVALSLSLAAADDLKKLVGKTEGKGGDNKPAPSRSADENKPTSPFNKGGDNKPRPADNGGSGNKPQPSNSPIPAPPADNDPFRKKPREQPGNNNGGAYTQPSNNPRPSPNNSGLVLNDPQPVRIDSRPVLTNPQPVLNRPVPLSEGNLPALVSRTEGLDPRRWQRFVMPPPRTSGYEFYYEVRGGNLSFGYRYYSYTPEPYRVCYAPYWYYDPCPPFIPVYRVIYLPPPRVVYVEVPVYITTPYYLERPSQPVVDDRQQLLSDIRHAWILRDPSLLERYIRPNSQIAIYLEGKYAYSLPAEDFLAITRDAIRAVKTEQLTFYRVSKRGEPQLVLRGEHRYIDEATGTLRVVYISYTFERVRNSWCLIEAGSSANRL
jgi:hypothetical protein